MKLKEDSELFLNIILKEGMYSNKGNLIFFTSRLFRDIDFKNKKVLDVGGGVGLLSFYAASRGALKVVCLEPEFDGSSKGMIDGFYHLSSLFQWNNVTHKPVTFQSFDSAGEVFDVIVIYNAINHLDESACINLLKNGHSKANYIDIFSKLHSLSSHGAKLIICDCSRYNFFATLKIRNPFAPMIEWQKHQAPETWANLLSEVGFVNPRISWLSFNTLRNFGKALLGNRFMAYFLISHFYLSMEKP